MDTKNKIRVELANGEFITVVLSPFDTSKFKSVLQEHTGLQFGEGNYFHQSIGMLNAWTCHKTSHAPNDILIKNAAKSLMLYGLAESKGGYTVLDTETYEILVFVPHPLQHYIIRIENRLEEMIRSNNWHIESSIMKVTKVYNGVIWPAYHLHEELKKALENEDYKSVSSLRRKIRKLNKWR